METLNAFKMELLEPRLEFRPLLSIFSAIWDGICWLGESAWDVIQAAVATAGPSVTYNFANDSPTAGINMPGFFKTLIANWESTWNEYW